MDNKTVRFGEWFSGLQRIAEQEGIVIDDKDYESYRDLYNDGSSIEDALEDEINNAEMRVFKRQFLLNTNTNKNGWRYEIGTMNEIVEAINSNNESIKYISLGYPEDLVVSLEKVIGKVDAAVLEDESLYIDLTLFCNSLPLSNEHINSLIKKSVFRPGGTGMVVDGVVQDYELTCIALVPAENDALNF